MRFQAVVAAVGLAMGTLTELGAAPAARAGEFTKDSPAIVLENIRRQKAVLVDVRSIEEWNKGHVAGAFFLPVTELEDGTAPEALAKRLPRRKILYTHCVVGMRAEVAGDVLAELGYTVRILPHGYRELIAAGFEKAAADDEASVAPAE